MTLYRYFLLSSVLQFLYSFNVQQYRFFFAPQALGFAPTLPPYIENPAAVHAKSYFFEPCCPARIALHTCLIYILVILSK